MARNPGIGIPPALAQLLMNPKQIARLAGQMADLQFGAPIGTLRRGIENEGTRHTQRVADIGSWFQQLAGNNQRSLEAVRANAERGLQSHDNAIAGLAGLAGGDAGVRHALSTSSLASRAGLEGINTAQGNFMENLKTVMGLQENDARIGETRRHDTNVGDLEAQLAQMLSQRGSAVASNRAQLMDQNFRNRIAGMDAGLSAALAGPQVTAAELENDARRIANAGARTANRAAVIGLTGARLANRNALADAEIKELQIAAGIRDMNERASAGNVPNFSDLDPGQLQGLEETLLGRVVSSKNPSLLAVNPLRAFNILGNAMRRMSLGAWNPKNDDQVSAWRDGLVRERIAAWNKAHPNQRFTWKNGRPVLITARNTVNRTGNVPRGGAGERGGGRPASDRGR